MLKHLLLLGWFRVKPFLNYVVVVTLIAPLVAASGNPTSARLSQVAKVTTNKTETTAVSEPQSDQVSLGSKAASSSDSLVKQSVAVAKPQLLQDELLSGTEENNTLSQIMPENDLLAAIELAPSTRESDSVSTTLSPSQRDLVERLRSAKIQIRSVTRSDGSVSKEVLTAQLMQAAKNGSQPSSTTDPAVEQPNENSAAQQDPVGSHYPIPWKWIQATQETMSSKGRSGVRYYRSVPVISPDGRYAIYSRVQLEVKPEMYNSRVTSVLFIEDRQTKKLQVVTTTSPIHDPLLKVNLSSRYGEQGSIAVLVPVSWSEKGDRFLARKFEGLMNTSDFTDHAVIWDRQKNHSNCVTPTQQKAEREMAVLLGWSKTHPDHVLFRAGEMGAENWPLVTVADDGSTAIATEADQPITFGQKVTELWAAPPVAYR